MLYDGNQAHRSISAVALEFLLHRVADVVISMRMDYANE